MSKGWNVLIVKKDGNEAKQFADGLKSIGARARIALNGQEAILFTGERAPDLIITEVDLPMLDGLETGRFLKMKFSGRSVPALIASAQSDVETVENSALIGFEEFVAEPVEIDVIVASASGLLALGKAENDLIDLERRRAGSKKGLPPEEDNSKELIETICSLRAAVSERLLSRGFPELVAQHVERIARLDPDDVRLEALRAQLK